MPLEWWQWEMARKLGWSLEYIESLSVGRMHEYWQILDGEHKAQKAMQKQAPRTRRRR